MQQTHDLCTNLRTGTNTHPRTGRTIHLLLILSVLLPCSVFAQFGTSPWTATNGTYTVPAGVTSITVECWGGGGGGGGAKSSSGGDVAGGGGGGGAYSTTTVSVTPGQTITVAVGTAGSAGNNNGTSGGNGGASSVTYNSSIVAQAAGGNGGGGGTSGAKTGGAGGNSGTGTVHNGGSGGNGYIGGSFDFGGGGGGSAGTNTNGGNGTTSTGTPVVNPPGGTAGSVGGATGGNGYYGLGGSGSSGNAPGSGGGGAAGYNGGSGSGGAGGAGKIIISYTAAATPAQPGPITGATTVCAGSTTTYAISTVSGATSYTWTLPNGWSGNSTTESITVIAGNNSGTVSVTADNANGPSTPQTLSVSVVATVPTATTSITGNQTVCVGSTQGYSVGAFTGTTSYGWTLPNGWNGSSTSTNITTTTGSSNGDIIVTASNVCGNTVLQLPIIVEQPVTIPGNIFGNDHPCEGLSEIYSIGYVGNNLTYNWTLPGGWSGALNSTSIVSTVGSSSGTISVTASNTCGASPAISLPVTVGHGPATPSVITGPNTVCNGMINTYSVDVDPDVIYYDWVLPNGWSGTSDIASITATAGSSGGTMEVIAHNDCGTSAVQQLNITVNSAPGNPGTITGSSAVCATSNYTYSIATISGASYYTWTLPNGWSGSSNTSSITAAAGFNGGNITVTANNDCGSSQSSTLAVTSNTVPEMPDPISGPDTICNLSTAIFSVPAVNNADSYTWTLPVSWTGNSSTESINATVGVSGLIEVTANNSCGSSPAQSFSADVYTEPGTPALINGSDTVCAGSNNTYSIALEPGATYYVWTLPSGWSGISTTESILATAGANGGTVSVASANTCGVSIPQSVTVSVNAAPATPSNITGDTALCDGSTTTYSIASINGATSYVWTLPASWGGTSNTESISATAGTLGGTITVAAANSCGTSQQQTLSVVANLVPANPGTISGPSAVCEGSTNTYNIATVNGATSYIWTLPNGWNGSSNTNSIAITAGSSNDDISVIAQNACGTSVNSSILSVAVNTIPQVTLSLPESFVCNNHPGAVLNLSGGTPSGGVFSGTGVTGTTMDGFGLSEGFYTVTYTVTQNGCSGSDSAQVQAVVCEGIGEAGGVTMQLYPIPFNESFTVILDGKFGKGEIALLDVSGRRVLTQSVQEGTTIVQVATAQLANGAYLVQFNADNKTIFARKVIKAN